VIARRALAGSVAEMVQPATLKDAALWKKASASLVAALPAGVLERAGRAGRVVVVPCDMLWRVPFEALPIAEGYLGDAVALTYLPSISSGMAAVVGAAPAGDRPDRFVAVAAPALPAALTSYLAQTAPDWIIRPAESAEREAKLSAGDHAAEASALLTGASATKAAARETLASAGVIHVAAPFRVNGASVLFSPILLAAPPVPADGPAPGANGIADSMLDLREVFNLDLHARLAVLSDGAALSMRDAASEVGVVQWAWRAAGVPSIALSRWPSDDGARERLLTELHRQLRAGRSAADALVAARRAVHRIAAWSAPFYWAGWIGVGGE
jgi:CHAT domain-containing protein